MNKKSLLVVAMLALASAAHAEDAMPALTEVTGHITTVKTIAGTVGALVLGFAVVKVGRAWLSKAK